METVFPWRRLRALLSLRFTTRQVPYIAVPDALRAAEGQVALYAHGERTILQEGAVAEIRSAGSERCRQLRADARSVSWEHDSDAPEPVGPVWLGGLAFQADDDPTTNWEGFPPAAFWLPKRQLWWEGERLYETTCTAPSLPTPEAAVTPIEATRPADWHATVDTACRAIQNGDFTKVVLARTAVASPTDACDAMTRLMAMEDGIGFLFRRGATFYGRSPERLVQLVDQEVTTHALAGTAAIDADGQHASDLRASGKDLLEHELVVAFVRERLVEAGIERVHQMPRRLREMRHVQHLETPIHGSAPAGTHILDIAAYLHPTPAVCGTPRARSMAFITEHEGFARGWYAGAIGWFDATGSGELAVALRCALQSDAARYLFAGAGIVAGSEPEAEWQETEHKLAAIREAG